MAELFPSPIIVSRVPKILWLSIQLPQSSHLSSLIRISPPILALSFRFTKRFCLLRQSRPAFEATKESSTISLIRDDDLNCKCQGRQPYCQKIGLKRGPWTVDEDQKLINFILNNGIHCWRLVPKLAGLLRCGKSCRLRWTTYLRPNLKRGTLTEMEENQIIQLHSRLGNRWSKITAHFPGRTDNEIKNHWNTRIKKRLKQLGLDPLSHKPIEQPEEQKIEQLCHSNSSEVEEKSTGVSPSETLQKEEVQGEKPDTFAVGLEIIQSASSSTLVNSYDMLWDGLVGEMKLQLYPSSSCSPSFSLKDTPHPYIFEDSSSQIRHTGQSLDYMPALYGLNSLDDDFYLGNNHDSYL